jgi:hypothetical protein
LRRELRRHFLDEFLHRSIVGVGQESAIEEWINPLVQRVTPSVDRGLFEWIALPGGQGPEPDFALFLECDGGCCFDEVLRGVDSKLFKPLSSFTFSDGTSTTYSY